ncbi:hypothetical protein Gasu2_50950 [Galdieria sulphuraria]|uniref:RING-type E3 ubiquitin transferase n=1 Tax=Galdieria sulphuraria TaxID=130081 RepID=M2W5D8_GALSU|nr:uncharacterized protein Gasu_17580 [Galdieria sulphuraria]EME30996.1 hypothetical protein Gasu_17580 [Galdieria sulphuraria]GJD10932.1 hypothetical protein Gasu2_50950 [Galdieria sulphuraria]|eukprot:XP_005707516.1 hypothetical protein Gasu_17580 [Galdieria sulphuraria]
MQLFSSILACRVIRLACWLSILTTAFRRRRSSRLFPKTKSLKRKYSKLIERLDLVAPEKSPTSCSKESCVICLESLENAHYKVRTVPCGHTFHSVCLDNWLIHVFSMAVKPQSLLDISWSPPVLSCPICKQNIPIV